jgi:hypothetical protein
MSAWRDFQWTTDSDLIQDLLLYILYLVTLYVNYDSVILPSVCLHILMQMNPIRCYACNINYIALLQATLLQVYHATVSYMDVGEGYIALHCTEPKLPGHIFRGDVNQTTAAIKTMEHYQTYPFFADEH